MTRITMADGSTVYVAKYRSESVARNVAARNNGTRKQDARGPGGAQRVILGDCNDPAGGFWVADCNRSASKLVKAGYDYAL